MIFSKVVNKVVESVVNVTDRQYIADNFDRYGDVDLYVETDPSDWTVTWGRVGYHYDSETGLFSDPDAPIVEEQ